MVKPVPNNSGIAMRNDCYTCIYSSVQAKPSVADRPESAATQTKLSPLTSKAAAAGDEVGLVTEPDAELVALLVVTGDLLLEEPGDAADVGAGEELLGVVDSRDEGIGVSPWGIDMNPDAVAQGVLV